MKIKRRPLLSGLLHGWRRVDGRFDNGTRTLRTLAWATTPTELHRYTNTIVLPPARDFKGNLGKARFP